MTRRSKRQSATGLRPKRGSKTVGLASAIGSLPFRLSLTAPCPASGRPALSRFPWCHPRLRGEGTTDAGDAGSGDGDARGASQPGTVRERRGREPEKGLRHRRRIGGSGGGWGDGATRRPRLRLDQDGVGKLIPNAMLEVGGIASVGGDEQGNEGAPAHIHGAGGCPAAVGESNTEGPAPVERDRLPPACRWGTRARRRQIRIRRDGKIRWRGRRPRLRGRCRAERRVGKSSSQHCPARQHDFGRSERTFLVGNASPRPRLDHILVSLSSKAILPPTSSSFGFVHRTICTATHSAGPEVSHRCRSRRSTRGYGRGRRRRLGRGPWPRLSPGARAFAIRRWRPPAAHGCPDGPG